MAKLGESQLGSTEFATGGQIEVSSEIDQAVRDRAEEVIKSVYLTDEGSDWDKILDVVLHEYKREHEVIGDIVSGRFIDDASGEQLDMLAEMWQIERRADERDDLFRARIKNQLPRHTGRATINEIINVSTTLLQTERSRIDVHENHYPNYNSEEDFSDDELPDDWDEMDEAEQQAWIDDREQEDRDAGGYEPARFDIVAEEIVFQDAGVEIEEYEELIQDVKPAGVRAFATIGEQFTHRSVTDYQDDVNNPDKGYGGFDHDTIEWTAAPDDDTNTTAYGEGAHGEGYYGGGSGLGVGHVTEGSERLDVGGPYADQISSQYT